MTALFSYVTQVRHRVDQLRLQKKELDIQMRVADAERQNTEAIIFSISDAVLVIDSFGELIMANTAAEKFFNFRSGEWRHRPLDRVVDDGSLVALIKDARTTGDHNVRRQVDYSTLRDGKTQTFNITLSTVVDANGQSRGVVAVFHDITREREIAQIKTDFVSAVSHELRTPLSSIKAYVEMLVDGEAHDENTRRHFYEIIQSETDRLQRLISNILNISRIESGVVEIQRQSIQANEVVQEVVAMMRPQADEKGLQLDCELDGPLPTLWADRDLLHRAILNVVGNAVKYTDQGGRVRIATRADAETGHVAVSISDNGIGIRSQDLPRIFDKFYRAPDSSSIAKGTGLGLNLVKHIVETVHDGEISVASEVGVGTTMILKFPVLAH
jgi:two-component system phosphate regulon sensor histidine kinase PhoR